MGAPHNPKRYGEVWPQDRIDAYLTDLVYLKDLVTLSGGWAWHFMSPVGHVELKHAHDHKDMDLFAAPAQAGSAMMMIEMLGYEKVRTKYDRLPSEEDFRRYERTQEIDGKRPVRLTIDFFVREVPSRLVHGYRVVDPAFLLTLYGSIHSSDKCFAVQAASKLLARGIDPVGRPELVQIPR